MRLPPLPPLEAFLAARAVPAVEEVVDGRYRRTVRLPHGPALVGVDGRPRADQRDESAARAAADRRAGRDPAAADAHLAGDPYLGPLIAARPGLRMPGTVDGGELAVRAVLGQQVSLAAARTLAGRLVAAAGEPLDEPAGSLTHLWPAPEAIVEAASALPMPRARQRAVATLAGALAAGLRLGPVRRRRRCANRSSPSAPLCPRTADYIAMRAIGDPRRVAADGRPACATASLSSAPRWRPPRRGARYRTHAVRHLWAAL